MQSQPLRLWKLGLITSNGVPTPNITWTLTWQHFLEVRRGACVESWVESCVESCVETWVEMKLWV